MAEEHHIAILVAFFEEEFSDTLRAIPGNRFIP
jgi:hypothetical protein